MLGKWLFFFIILNSRGFFFISVWKLHLLTLKSVEMYDLIFNSVAKTADFE